MKRNNELIRAAIAKKRWQNEVLRKDIEYCPYRPKKKNKSKRKTKHFGDEHMLKKTRCLDRLMIDSYSF